MEALRENKEGEHLNGSEENEERKNKDLKKGKGNLGEEM